MRRILLLFVVTCMTPTGTAQDITSSDDLDFDDLPEVMEDQLYALGYLDGYRNSPAQTGVTVHDPEAVGDGANLVLSPHKLGADLVDMTGTPLHAWEYDVWVETADADLPDYVRAQRDQSYDYWSKVHLVDNGDLLFIHKGVGLFRIDQRSKLCWVAWLPAHHDLQVQPDGSIVTLIRYPWTSEADTNAAGADHIVYLSETGDEQRRISIPDAIRKSCFAALLAEQPNPDRYLHTNKAYVLDGVWANRDPAFRAGNVLVSCRNIHALVVIDTEQGEAVWALTGSWRAQHDPRPLHDTLLLFDNRGNDGCSRVLEIDPFTKQTDWTYTTTPARFFCTEVGGTSQRLKNGNTLITESTNGRAFEVNRDGDVVWEYVNPARVGPRKDKISPLFEVQRVFRPRFLDERQ